MFIQGFSTTMLMFFQCYVKNNNTIENPVNWCVPKYEAAKLVEAAAVSGKSGNIAAGCPGVAFSPGLTDKFIAEWGTKAVGEL